ncbi:MAG: carbohydrate kinase family protein [Iphinoe sp. HA4291-MV1]|jgi:sugar/nucleoside kinase (ribokinase family)|nr:carbohydrate kinase family protein [Iphinoe sp. HA4291-MV1]
MKNAYDMVVLGDINLDWYSIPLLSYAFSELVSNGKIEWTPIDEFPGGSGLIFARFAKEMGYKPFLLGKIGDDSAAQFILNWLNKQGIESGLFKDTTLSTGKAFIIRDKNDIRFLVNNWPNANQYLSVSDVEMYADVIQNSRILYVSGYCIMNPDAPRTEATKKALYFARQNSQIKIIFDVVPHQIYTIYNFNDFREITGNIDILISEVATMRRFLKLGHRQEEITRALVEETAGLLNREGYVKFMLRFGPSGMDYQAMWDYSRSSEPIWWETEHKNLKDKRGYGDQLAIKALRDVYKLKPMF